MNLLPIDFLSELNTATMLTQSRPKAESTHGTHMHRRNDDIQWSLKDPSRQKAIKFESLEKLFPVRLMNTELDLCLPWFFISSGRCFTFVYWRTLLVIVSWSYNWESIKTELPETCYNKVTTKAFTATFMKSNFPQGTRWWSRYINVGE